MPRARQIPLRQVVFSPEERARILVDIDAVLESGWLTLGPQGEAFEREFAARIGAAHAVATSSGSAALEIVWRSLGVAGREVIVPANTFFASASTVVHAGAVPVFCDVDARTLMPQREHVRAARTPRTAAVLLVHIGGAIAPEIEAIADWCAAEGLWLVEDAAHAAGSRLNGRSAGLFGIAAAFSLYPTKVITAAEGGLIVTFDAGLAAEARIYRDQGKRSFSVNEHIRMGSSWRLSEVHAVIGRSQLRLLDTFIAARQAIAARYDEGLTTVRPLHDYHTLFCNFYKYCAWLPHDVDRDVVKAQLRDRSGLCLASEVYATPLHRQPVFGGVAGDLPGADEAASRHICLPISAGMTVEEADEVIRALNGIPCLL